MPGDDLALKLILTPLLIGAASLVGRRWGPSISGWLVGFPFTSGPIALFLALSHGAGFAAAAAVGITAGTLSQAAFCLAYAWLAPRISWAGCTLAGTAAFAAGTVLLEQVPGGPAALFGAALAGLAGTLLLLPRLANPVRRAPRPLPSWDIPLRMAVATAFVLVLTGIATHLGPRLTGLLAPFPLYAAILAVFAHRQQGSVAARAVLRGLVVGLFSFSLFFFSLAELLPRVGIGPAFTAATAAGLSLQAVSLWMLRHPSPGRTRAALAAARSLAGGGCPRE
ncbi:MAG: hypothetical protein ACREPA_11285 [Candidatus Dormibacteraceae bacterium]